MMEEKKPTKRKSRVNIKLATLAVQKILKTQTDASHPISINGLVEKLCQSSYGLECGRDTVKSILDALQVWETCICCKQATRKNWQAKKEEGEEEKQTVYTYDYYYDSTKDETGLTDEEIQWLIEDVMFSSMHTTDQVTTLLKKLKSLASISCRSQLNYTEQIPYQHYTANAMTQKNLVLLHQAIAQQKPVHFVFNGYGGELVDGKEEGEKVRELNSVNTFTVQPIQICVVDQRYYLICLFAGYEKWFHFRIDLMTDLEILKENLQEKRTMPVGMDRDALSQYLLEHPYMYYDAPGNTPVNFILRVTKIPNKPNASMTFLQDVFGNSWQVWGKDTSEETVDVRVRCVPSAMQVFVRQYIDRVKIIGPPKYKKIVEDGLKKEFEEYWNRE
ncbi:MAG: WYL domain-containing protein [Lachnospiraceae bacterium]